MKIIDNIVTKALQDAHELMTETWYEFVIYLVENKFFDSASFTKSLWQLLDFVNNKEDVLGEMIIRFDKPSREAFKWQPYIKFRVRLIDRDGFDIKIEE